MVGTADLAHYNFTGKGTVTSLTLKRIGVSADTTLSNVYLFDGATRLTDAATVSSGSVVNFSNSSGLFMVDGMKTISVKADLAGSAGETVGVSIDSASNVTTSGSVAVSGTFPANGNLHSLATATTFATVAFSGHYLVHKIQVIALLFGIALLLLVPVK